MPPDERPAFIALATRLDGTTLYFERLNVDASLLSGAQAAYLLEPDQDPHPLTVIWPGLAPGLYDANDMEVMQDG